MFIRDVTLRMTRSNLQNTSVKTQESLDIARAGGDASNLLVPQVSSAVRRHSTGNTMASAAALAASRADFQQKLPTHCMNTSMDMMGTMHHHYGLLHIGSNGRVLRRK